MPTASSSWPSNTGRRPVGHQERLGLQGPRHRRARSSIRGRRARRVRSCCPAGARSLLLQRGDERRGGVLVLVGQDLGEHLERGDRRAEPRVDLRELDADRAGADHRERGRRGVRSPDRLPVRPERAVGQPLDRRHRGLGAGGEHDPVGLELWSRPRAAIRCSPVRRACWRNTRDPRVLEGLRALAGAGVDHLVGAALDRRQVHLDRGDPQAEPRRRPSRARAILALRSITLVGTQP